LLENPRFIDDVPNVPSYKPPFIFWIFPDVPMMFPPFPGDFPMNYMDFQPRFIKSHGGQI
jgi:hypothetical protein